MKSFFPFFFFSNYRISVLLIFSCTLFVLCLFNCTYRSNEIEYAVIEKDTAKFREMSAKYVIDNKYGEGYILLNDDNTYEHVFNDGDSCYVDYGIWDAVKTGNEGQSMPFGGVDIPEGYNVILRDWYWRFPVDGKTDPHQKILESLSYETDHLSCQNVNVSNAQVNFFKESVYSGNGMNYRLSSKDTTQISGDNFVDYCVELGRIKLDSAVYQVTTVFRKIAVADGFKGAGFLIFRNDSLNFEIAYEADMPSDLPVDIYENNFVFRSDNSLFCFDGGIEMGEMLCFECKSCMPLSNMLYQY